MLLSAIATSPALAMAGKQLVDDFSVHPVSNWEFVTDQVMGGVSTGEFAVVEEEDQVYARMVGEVSTKNNGGFIQFRRKMGVSDPESVSGVYLIVRGNGQGYFVHLRSRWTLLPWQYYQAPFETTEEWQELRISLDQFRRSSRVLPEKISAKDVRSLGIVAFGRDHNAEVSVREVGFF